MAASCMYCGSDLRPNSMFCLECGQIVARKATHEHAVGSRSQSETRDRYEVPSQTRAPEPREPVAEPVIAPLPPMQPPAQVAPNAPEDREWVLTCSTGSQPVVKDLFVGRRPSADASAAVLVLEDPTRTLSRTHAVVRVVGDGLVVEDLGSANGTRLERAGQWSWCQSGNPVAVAPGDIVHFGGAPVSFTVRQAS